MLRTLAILAALLPALALVAMVASFAPVQIADFDRFTMRVAGVVVLLLAFIAHEARNIARGR